MPKLVERQRVKDYCNLARTDVLWDSILDGMIQQAGHDVERLCRRQFLYEERIEYHTSYDQYSYEVTPQYVFTEAWPIDPDKLPIIKWAPYNDHSTFGVVLDPRVTPPDFIISSTDPGFVDTGFHVGPSNWGSNDVIVIRGINNITTNVPVYNTQTFPFIRYAERGWQVHYWGGYKYLTEAPTEPYDPDPMDDFNVIGVPEGLRNLIALKIAGDFLASISTQPVKRTLTYPSGPRQALMQVPVGVLMPWAEEERAALRLYRRKDKLGS